MSPQSCDASILMESTTDAMAEHDSHVNNPPALVRGHRRRQGVVSCVVGDSVVLTGGPHYDIPGGRRDGMVSLASEVGDNIPAPTFDLSTSVAIQASIDPVMKE